MSVFNTKVLFVKASIPFRISCGKVRFNTFTPIEKRRETPTRSLYSLSREKRDDEDAGFVVDMDDRVYQILTNSDTLNSYSIAFPFESDHHQRHAQDVSHKRHRRSLHESYRVKCQLSLVPHQGAPDRS